MPSNDTNMPAPTSANPQNESFTGLKQALNHGLKPWLALVRASNLPTVWSNVLAGVSLSGAQPIAFAIEDSLTFGLFIAWLGWLAMLLIAATTMYLGGMAMNDAVDAAFDRTHRNDRPIAQGLIQRKHATLLAAGLLLLGWLLAWTAGPKTGAIASALVLCIAIYNALHKRFATSLVFMGLCRTCVVLTAGMAMVEAPGIAPGIATGIALGSQASSHPINEHWAVLGLGVAVWAHAVLLGLYTLGVTIFARSEHIAPKRKRHIPTLLAGMCLLDAVVIFGFQDILGVVCLGLFFLTRRFQRVISGT